MQKSAANLDVGILLLKCCNTLNFFDFVNNTSNVGVCGWSLTDTNIGRVVDEIKKIESVEYAVCILDVVSNTSMLHT